MQNSDTIVAISTPLGEGGIGIVRLSGTDAFSIARQMFECKMCGKETYPQPRTLYHGFIRNKDSKRIDEVLTAFMPAPKTYTREDIVEINCHSGIINLRLILKLTLEYGARLAEPGEFTKRAFINGRIDLSQAEAVMNIVRARSEEAVHVATKSLQGELTKEINKIRDSIITIRAPLEAWFDYPDEYEDYVPSSKDLKKGLARIQEEISGLLQGVERNRAYQEGVSVAIIGRPNVGKSSLLNALLRQQKAIVHEVPGTTRDMLEGFMNLGGYPVRLVDTAGIQGTKNPVEKEGIVRSRRAADEARLLIMVVDSSVCWSKADEEIAGIRKPHQGLVVVANKKDLDRKITLQKILFLHPDAKIVETAAINGAGIDELERAVTEQLDHLFGEAAESPAVVSLRHEEILKEALMSILNAGKVIDKQPLELISLDLYYVWSKLGEITGDTVSDALLDRIFSEFCLGK